MRACLTQYMCAVCIRHAVRATFVPSKRDSRSRMPVHSSFTESSMYEYIQRWPTVIQLAPRTDQALYAETDVPCMVALGISSTSSTAVKLHQIHNLIELAAQAFSYLHTIATLYAFFLPSYLLRLQHYICCCTSLFPIHDLEPKHALNPGLVVTW